MIPRLDIHLRTQDLIPEGELARIWRSLNFFNIYRIALGALFLFSVLRTGHLPILGSTNPRLFAYTTLAYLSLATVAMFLIHWRRPSYAVLAHALTLLDILVLTLIMHTSGGIETGLGMLLVVSIAGSSLLLVGRTATLYAALATLALLFEQMLAQWNTQLAHNYAQAGILGASLFATATLAHVLSKRLRESEALATERGIDLANMAQLNEHIIRSMQSGIIVVDADQRVRLLNEAAWHMLGLAASAGLHNTQLRAISPELATQLVAWQTHRSINHTIFRPRHSSIDILPGFMALGSHARSGTLISLEDTARMAQQAQQMKLASLGRLTASIAHEIRNPLSAISHAEQLLAEAPERHKAEQRLLHIIHTNTERVNNIINNVLQLSRRQASLPQQVELKPWLEKFRDEFAQLEHTSPDALSINVDPPHTLVRVDPSQLQQILTNLCQNGLRYSADHPHQPKLELVGGISPELRRPFLDVIDHGPGIDPDLAQTIFEPFFTTEAHGSGLGLYIARELCECNQARLSYIAIPTGGSCFRIEFSADSPSTAP